MPPTTYTYIDLTPQQITIAPGAFFSFGYQNTGLGGQVAFEGVDSWAWYGSFWDPDQGWARTAVLQVKASYGGATPVDAATWGSIKHIFMTD
jgi:hypothetical protein